MRIRLYDGMAANGITGKTADEIYEKIQAFAAFGFAESHSIIFRAARLRLVLAEAALPSGVLCRAAQRAADGLLLAAVARARREAARHRGAQAVAVLARWPALRWRPGYGPVPVRLPRRAATGGSAGAVVGAHYRRPTSPRRSWRLARRTDRSPRWPIWPGGSGCRPIRSRRWPLPGHSTLRCHPSRRACGQPAPRRRRVRVSSVSLRSARQPPAGLPEMTEPEQLIADMWATGITPSMYPTALIRPRLDALGIVTAARTAIHFRPHPGH